MAKQVMFEDEARRKVLAGIRKLAGAVKVTMGPSGRNVILDKKGGTPEATRDGITVSKEVELRDPFENIGAKLANSAADKTNDVAGDGTTTSAVLAEAMYREGMRLVGVGVDSARLKRGMDKAVEAAIKAVEKLSRPVKGVQDFRHVALVASHFEEEVAELVAQAIEKTGRDGVITVEESHGLRSEIEEIEGLQFDKGYISPYFVNNPDTLTADFEDAAILLTDKKISNVKELIPLLEQVARAGKPLLIVAEDVEGEALALLILNKLRGMFRVAAVKAPAFGDRRKAMLQDIAILTGGTVVTEEVGNTFEKLTLADLGSAKRVKVERDHCTLIGGGGEKKMVKARIDELRSMIRKTTSTYDKEKYEERLAKLVGGVAVIKVGGRTESEMKERKFRVDDAVHAARAAGEAGVVPGGGVAYLRAAEAVNRLKLEGDELAGARVVARALDAPLAAIAANAGQDPSCIVADVKERTGSQGFDAKEGKFVDMMKAGIMDAAKVCTSAIRNSASVASMLLTSNAVVAELKDNKKAVAGAVK